MDIIYTQYKYYKYIYTFYFNYMILYILNAALVGYISFAIKFYRLNSQSAISGNSFITYFRSLSRNIPALLDPHPPPPSEVAKFSFLFQKKRNVLKHLHRQFSDFF